MVSEKPCWRKVKQLLEKHSAREAFQILATQIILAKERIPGPSSSVPI
ncbi:MAG TPA: hypothetical protein VNW25_01320 [Candidatus Sulfotelmatobacter sp.]|nr:hypothetical protein [Candidatus Sulfotelmatobacter sp.]